MRSGLMALAAAALLAPAVFGQAGQVDETLPVKITRISDRVAVATAGSMNNNMIAVATGKGIVIVDSMVTPTLGRMCAEAIAAELGRADFTHVINTHFHQDHTAGNCAFADALIVGHEYNAEGMQRQMGDVERGKVFMRRYIQALQARLGGADPDSEGAGGLRMQLAEAEMILSDLEGGYRLAAPQLTFSDRLTLALGDITFRLFHVGPAHSEEGDVIIFVPEEGLLMTGDLLVSGGFPSLFRRSGMDLDSWLVALDAALEAGVRAVVPGHEGPMAAEEIRLYRDYFAAIQDRVARARAEGLTFIEALESIPVSDFPELAGRRLSVYTARSAHRNNLSILWNPEAPSGADAVYEKLNEEGLEAALALYDQIKGSRNCEYFFDEGHFNYWGYALLREERLEEATAILRMCTEIFPYSDNAFDSLADACIAAGRTPEAVSCLQRALELYPDSAGARAKLQALSEQEP